MKRFHTHKKQKKHKKHKTQTSNFHLDVFYAHKNAVFFVSRTKKHNKHKKHIKSIKMQISEKATFLPLGVF